jgi:flavin-binding protein dodecin
MATGDRTYKITKLVGESPTGIEDAVRVALTTSGEKVHGQSWAEIRDLRARLADGGDVELWQVTVEVAFEVDR